MFLFKTINLLLKHLKTAIRLYPIVILCVVFAEGLQHIVEWQLGMYQSAANFAEFQSNKTRLSFGILKAITVLIACYFIPKKLFETYGPPPVNGSFNADMLRKLWDPRGGVSGLMAMLVLAVPLIFFHYQLSYRAMGSTFAPVLLILDSLLIGALAAVMGTAIWAGDYVERRADKFTG